MTSEDKARAADMLLSTPIVIDLLNEIEGSAINKCVNAAPDNDQERAAYAAEVRAIRRLRSDLELIRVSTSAKRKAAL
jgi:hypothetical protein